ncbi:MAG TPA: ATP-binding protein [Stellaceae bacterium]|nr:ATP-binding protein [Stellaceae bacterium]
MSDDVMQGGASDDLAPVESAPFLAGGGELGARMRSFNWRRTPLGPPQDWPRSLKTAVRIMLTSRQPIWIGWGPELTYLYNDPYKSIIGGKHPWALGRPVGEVWREIWADIGPMLAQAMQGDEGTYNEEQLLIMERSGYPEETYYTFSYSPIPDDEGGVGGIICANTDDTRRVIGERQLQLLRELSAATVDARTVEQACERSARALASDKRDLPFAALYLAAPDSHSLKLAGVSGIARGHHAAPETLSLDAVSVWPLVAAMSEPRAQLVRGLQSRFDGDFPTGAWDQPPSQAAAIRIPARGDTGRPGLLIAGLNPFRLFDDDYRRFLDLVASEIGAAIANAEAYEQERRRAEALAEIDRAKTVFFSNISHEFRTPLALMLGPIEDALNDATLTGRTPAQRGRLDIVYRNALRLLRLVNTLLDFSRIEAGRVTMRFEPLDLAALTADLASSFRSLTDRAGLVLTIDCADLGVPVFVDREMWEKIVLNLLSNAFKFTLAGEIAVALRARGAMAELIVRDTGTGIAEDELPRLFERFHRIEGSEGRSFEGSGIGLAMVYELAKQLGGSIAVESKLGEGSAFTVTVPLGTAHLPHGASTAPPEATASSNRAAAPSNRAAAYVQEALRWLSGGASASDAATTVAADDFLDDSSPASGNGARVLLADDNADMREYIRRLLIGKGYEVETAADGKAALDAARRQRPSLVISDVMMPRLDGLGLLAAIRSDRQLRKLPVILLSARAGEDARIEGLDAGADDYVSKPFSARELLARVRANLQLANLRRQAESVQREQAVLLEATVRTVPTAVWYTHDAEAQGIYGNDYAARLLRLPLTSTRPVAFRSGNNRPFRALRNGHRVPTAELPLRRALVGEMVENEELDLHFDDGTKTTMICQSAPIRDEQGVIVGAVCGALDITYRKRHEEHQKLLLNELNHRVKNTLAMVQSLTMQTLRSTVNIVEGRDALVARLIALAKAHDVLTRENWEGAGLHDVVVEALAAHLAQSEQRRLWFDGPELKLRPRASLALSMAFHELATNAVKYGALSSDQGRVDMAWSFDERKDSFALQWVESGGPAVQPPQKRGFGSRLIERGLAQDLGGSVRLEFKPEGIVCTIRTPLTEVQAQIERHDDRAEKVEP